LTAKNILEFCSEFAIHVDQRQPDSSNQNGTKKTMQNTTGQIKATSVWKNNISGENVIVRFLCADTTFGREGNVIVVFQKTLDKGTTLLAREKWDFFAHYTLVAE
jgi:hypothetical protein